MALPDSVSDSDPQQIATAAAWAAESVLLSHRDAATILGWPSFVEFDVFLAEVED